VKESRQGAAVPNKNDTAPGNTSFNRMKHELCEKQIICLSLANLDVKLF
jgi:hypothetical protein